MSKLRSISTAIWSDPYFEDLNAKETLFFLYLLTNSKTNMLGVYEISRRKMLFESKLNNIKELETILEKFKKDKKVFYINNYIFLVNFLKHQRYNLNSKKSAINTYNSLPNIFKKKDIKTISSTVNANVDEISKSFKSLLKGFGMVSKESVAVKKDVKREVSIVKKEANIPTLAEFMAYARLKDEKNYQFKKNNLKLKYNSWVENGWKTVMTSQ